MSHTNPSLSYTTCTVKFVNKNRTMQLVLSKAMGSLMKPLWQQWLHQSHCVKFTKTYLPSKIPITENLREITRIFNFEFCLLVCLAQLHKYIFSVSHAGFIVILQLGTPFSYWLIRSLKMVIEPPPKHRQNNTKSKFVIHNIFMIKISVNAFETRSSHLIN